MFEKHGLDLAVLLGYLVLVVGYGCWFAWRTNSSEQFMSAGRSIPGWAVGMSIFGSYISGISFMANPGKAYAGNWNAFVFALSMPLGIWISATYFVPFYRRTGHVSAYEHFEARFGNWARTYSVVCFLLTQFARLGMILFMMAVAFRPLLGVDLWTIIIVSGIAITIYPLFGGTEGVIWTGVVQSLVLVAGVLVCLFGVMYSINGGVGALLKEAVAKDKFSLGAVTYTPPPRAVTPVENAVTTAEKSAGEPERAAWTLKDAAIFHVSQSTFWVILIMGMVTHLQNFGVDQGYIQRYVTAKSDADAARSVWLGGLCFIPLSAMFFFIGTGLYVFYKQQSGDVSSDLQIPPGTKPEGVLPFFIGTQLPPGVMGLVLAAVFSAAMDSNLNCCATLYLCDIHRRYFRPQASERESMWVLHVSTFVMGALSIATALILTQIDQAALDIWWKLVGILSGGVLGLFLLGIMSRRATSFHAAIGVAAGVTVIAWMTVTPLIWKYASKETQQSWINGGIDLFFSPFNDNMILVVGSFTVFIVGWAVSRFSPRMNTETLLPALQEPAT